MYNIKEAISAFQHKGYGCSVFLAGEKAAENKNPERAEEMMLQLHNSWDQLLQTWDVEQAQTAFSGLVAAYSSLGRVYHTLVHIQDMLQWIERLRDHANNLAVLQLSIWFHDSVYDPHATDNEEQSVAYAQSTLSGLGLPLETIQIVAQMILSTKTHSAAKDDVDCQILLDADLAILGAPVARYETYAWAIRQEYSWVAEAAYRAARVQVLQTFLQRTRIYWTEPMFVALEVQARENVGREIATLSHVPSNGSLL